MRHALPEAACLAVMQQASLSKVVRWFSVPCAYFYRLPPNICVFSDMQIMNTDCSPYVYYVTL
jgi:hypothetical protein